MSLQIALLKVLPVSRHATLLTCHIWQWLLYNLLQVSESSSVTQYYDVFWVPFSQRAPSQS